MLPRKPSKIATGEKYRSLRHDYPFAPVMPGTIYQGKR